MKWPPSFLNPPEKKDSAASKLNGSRATEEQALLVHIRFSDDQAGTKAERDRAFQLEDELIAFFEESTVGEFDGNEIGGGFFTLYMYGPSAQELWETVAPFMRRFRPPVGSYAIKRYGKPGAAEDRIDLSERG